MDSLNYVRCSKGEKLPANAVLGGFDGAPYYHARGVVDKKRIPGKVAAPNQCLTNAYIPYALNEHLLENFEVLTSELTTSHVACRTGDALPENAVEAGYDDGVPYYHARGKVAGLEIPGKVAVRSEQERFLAEGIIPYDGKEHYMREFQVLVISDTICSVDFQIDDSKILSTTPKVIAKQENRNDSSVTQSMEFSFNETVTDTSTFTHQKGVKISVGTEFTCGIPEVCSGKIEHKVTGSSSRTWGTSNSTSKSFTAKFPVSAAPGSTVVCQAVVNETELEVPYTITFKSGKQSFGVWSGVSTWGLRSSFKDI